jgi:hypothetical protein
MRAWAVIVTCACTGASQKPMLENGIEQLLATSSRGDATGISRLLAAPLDTGGVWFEDAACRRQFSSAGRFEQPQVAELARCLAGLRLAADTRPSAYPDIATFVYSPGIEVEVAFVASPQGPKVRWIGHASQVSAHDDLPTVTPAVLEAHRQKSARLSVDDDTRAKLDRELADRKSKVASTTLKVCIDSSGAVTGVHPRITTSALAQRALIGLVQSWTFDPVILGGQPSAVCAVLALGYPADKLPANLPLPPPIPESHESTLIVSTEALGQPRPEREQIEGGDDVSRWMKSRRIETITTAVLMCLDETGAVASVLITRPSGIPQFDRTVHRVLSARHYAPFLVDGHPTRVCAPANHSHWVWLR